MPTRVILRSVLLAERFQRLADHKKAREDGHLPERQPETEQSFDIPAIKIDCTKK
jgi:hypothetical protein